ncbi:Zinc finger, RING-type [Dillenia turbinata]|uniref:Zinc finger, RING-type n=1 Tax=Dillenia turbinata TaxID=194707 RepID=A0AAN8UMJ9_9MAGN
MGFPVGYTELLLPKLFLHTLSLLTHLRTFLFSLFHFLGLDDFLEPTIIWPNPPESAHDPVHLPDPPISALLIRELLPVIKFSDLTDDPPESCAVCLYEFEGKEEIRRLTNCKHIFHRMCLDRWMDCDQKTCPLCRTQFVPSELQEEFNERFWAASGFISPDLYSGL